MYVEVLGDGHATAQSDTHVLMLVDFRLDVLKDPFCLLYLLCEHFEILSLLEFDHLEESFAGLHVVGSDVLVSIEGCHGAPLLLKHHVESADAIDRVCFLPDHFKV